MANYDAKIRIGTDIDTSKLKSLQIQMNKAVDKAAALADKMNKLKDQHIPTKEYTDLQNELTKAEKHADSLYGKLRVMESSGKVNTEGYEKLKVQVKYADSEIQHLRNSMDELEKSGGAFTLGADTDAYQKLSAQYRDANAQVSLLAAKQEEVINKNKRTSASGEAISDAFKKVYSSATKSFRALISGGKKSNSLLSTMKSRMSGLALSLLIFNQISKGFNSSVNGMKEGFQNLARYSDETNQVMSEFKGELETTKNSLAVAFEPLALTVIPYFTQFLGVLNSACNSLAWFMAIVSGKNTYKKATNQMVDYADSLNSAGSAARNALAAFDELNVLSKPEAGSGSTSPEDMFEEVETGVPDDWTAGLVDAINMGDWEEAGKLLAEKLNEAAGEIDYTKVGATIGKGLTNAFAAGNGFLSNVDTLSIGAGLATILNTAMEELDEELVGKTAAETINRIFDAAFGFLSTFDFKAAGAELGGIIRGFIANIDLGEAGQNVSMLAIGILNFVDSAIEEVEWSEVGEKIGEFLEGIDWKEVLEATGELFWDALKAVLKAWGGMFDAAPIETAILTAIGLLKFSGLGNVLGTALASGISSASFPVASMSKIASAFGAALLAALAGLAIGRELGVALFPEDAEYYGDSLSGYLRELFGAMNMEDAYGAWKEFSKEVKNDLNELLTESANEFEDMPKEILSNLWGGSDDAFGVKDILQLVGDGCISIWESATGTASASSELMDQLLKQLGLNALGSQSVISGALIGISGITSQTTSEITTAWQNGEIDVCAAVDGITAGMEASFESAYNDVMIKTSTFLEEIKSMFDEYSIGVSGMAIGGASFVADLPQYANGAVFTGGNPYVAVVNDQPAGQTNVEAPVSVIEDAVRGVMQESGGYNAQISLEVDGRTFARLMHPYMQAESRRIGVNFRNN